MEKEIDTVREGVLYLSMKTMELLWGKLTQFTLSYQATQENQRIALVGSEIS